MTMQVIQHIELGSAAASIEFASIPTDGTDLLLVLSGRGTIAQTYTEARIRLNGATSNYSFRALQGSGSGTVSFSSDGTTTSLRVGLASSANATSNTFGNLEVYIPNYRSSVAKSVSSNAVSENNATEAYQEMIAGLWNDTSAVNSLLIVTYSGHNWATGTSATLYKITKGSDGTTTVS